MAFVRGEQSRYTIDFDFGENGEIDGIELYRLIEFWERQNDNLNIRGTNELESLFKSACENGELIYSGYILWYLRKDIK